jgi:hypothetical protein
VESFYKITVIKYSLKLPGLEERNGKNGKKIQNETKKKNHERNETKRFEKRNEKKNPYFLKFRYNVYTDGWSERIGKTVYHQHR